MKHCYKRHPQNHPVVQLIYQGVSNTEDVRITVQHKGTHTANFINYKLRRYIKF